MPASDVCIGVLGLQGCVEPHRAHVEASGASFCVLRKPQDLARVHGLILPGGESTVQLKLIEELEWQKPLEDFAKTHPVWGICAGAILMAKSVVSPLQKSFSWISIEVARNAFGRQLDSFEWNCRGAQVAFIRAPRILAVDSSTVKTLASLESGEPVWVSNGLHWAMTFHPELSLLKPSPMHQDFVNLVAATVDGSQNRSRDLQAFEP